MSSTEPQASAQSEISTSPRFVNMTGIIAKHLLNVHGVEDLDRAIQLFAVVENGVFDYINQESAKLSESTLGAYTAWINSGKKKLTRT